MTKQQIEKELNRQATLFEERVKCTTTHDGNIRLKEFTDRFLKEYAYPNLKARTAYGYEERMAVVNEALGHIKLKDLKPGHIAAFYSNLQEEGMRRNEYAVSKMDFAAWLEEHHDRPIHFHRGVCLGIQADEKRTYNCQEPCPGHRNRHGAGIRGGV